LSIQAILIAAGGLFLLGSTVTLVRSRLLSIRYGLGWSVLALLAIIGAPVLEVLAASVRGLGFTPTGFSLGIFVACLAAICVQLSISVSGAQRIAQDLAEYSALLEERVVALEARLPASSPDAGSHAPASPDADDRHGAA
jgi:Na+/melibiose symporter-like transporter